MTTLTIKEVSRRAGLSTPTLRFWAKELEGVIVPQRTKGGQRRYTMEHLLVIEEIKGLKGKGLSLSDIKRAMNYRVNSGEKNYSHQTADLIADKIAEIVRTTIFDFLNGKIAKE